MYILLIVFLLALYASPAGADPVPKGFPDGPHVRSELQRNTRCPTSRKWLRCPRFVRVETLYDGSRRLRSARPDTRMHAVTGIRSRTFPRPVKGTCAKGRKRVQAYDYNPQRKTWHPHEVVCVPLPGGK